MPSCIVSNCKYYSGKKVEGVTLHVFPKNLEVIRRWLQQVEEAGQSFGDLDAFAQRVYSGKRSDTFRICSQHFTDDCYAIQANYRRVMKKDSIPTIFPAPQEGDKRPQRDPGPPQRRQQRGPTRGTGGPRSRQQGMKWGGSTELGPAHEDQRRILRAVRGEDQIGVAEKILDITMEIIYLLTGEDYILTKKSDGCVTHGRSSHLTDADGPPGTQSPSPVPPPHSQKILELTHKMLSLLTGEVPVRCDDVTVYFSMEEWEYLEEHQELYRDVMMETRQPRTSPVNGATPVGPLWSADETVHAKFHRGRCLGAPSPAHELTRCVKEEPVSGSEWSVANNNISPSPEHAQPEPAFDARDHTYVSVKCKRTRSLPLKARGKRLKLWGPGCSGHRRPMAPGTDFLRRKRPTHMESADCAPHTPPDPHSPPPREQGESAAFRVRMDV